MALPGQLLGGLLVFGLVLKQILDVWIGSVSVHFATLPGL